QMNFQTEPVTGGLTAPARLIVDRWHFPLDPFTKVDCDRGNAPDTEIPLWRMDRGMAAMSTNPGRMKRGVPEGLWIRCPQCKSTISGKEAEPRLNVCPECDHHFYVPSADRIQQLLDQDSFEEWFKDLKPKDPLQFKDRVNYSQRIKAEQTKTGMNDAV